MGGPGSGRRPGGAGRTIRNNRTGRTWKTSKTSARGMAALEKRLAKRAARRG